MDLPDIVIGHVALFEESSSNASAMNFLSSSSSESDSDSASGEDDQIEEDILFPIFQILLHGRRRTRVLDFVDRALAKSDTEFREDFRVSRLVFHDLLDQLERSGAIPDHDGGRPKKSASLSLLMTLWFLANNNCSHRSLSNLFNISFSSVSRIVRRVIGWLLTLMPQWIVWPRGNEVQRVSHEFEEKADIGSCIGSIDGSHIPIIKPEVNGREYYNPKQSYSLVLQAVVDCNLKFTNVYCGDPGSFHDTRVLRRSDLYNQVQRNIPASFHNGTFLLGDKGYIGVGKQWIVTPFRDNGNLVQEQVDFNRRVLSTRVVVEQAFGILKGRFRRLKSMELRDVRFAVEVVIASCGLHNICRCMGDDGVDFADDRNNPQVNADNNDNGNAENDNARNNYSDSDGDDNDYDDDLIPAGEEEPPRQISLFTQMYPNAVLPAALCRRRCKPGNKDLLIINSLMYEIVKSFLPLQMLKRAFFPHYYCNV